MASDRDDVINERERADAQSRLEDIEERLRGLRMEFSLYDNPWWDQYREWLAESLEHLKTSLVEADPHDFPLINLLQGSCRQTLRQIERRDTLLGEIEAAQKEIRDLQEEFAAQHPG